MTEFIGYLLVYLLGATTVLSIIGTIALMKWYKANKKVENEEHET